MANLSCGDGARGAAARWWSPRQRSGWWTRGGCRQASIATAEDDFDLAIIELIGVRCGYRRHRACLASTPCL